MEIIADEYRDLFDGKNVLFDMRIHILEARSLNGKAVGLFSAHGLNDPYILCKHLDWEEKTNKQEKVVNAFYDRVMLRTFRGQPADFFGSALVISAYHGRTLASDVLIGYVTFGITDIFLSPGHLVPTQWFPLLDPDNPDSDSPGKAMGYLKLQISINGPNEVSDVELKSSEWEYRRTEIVLNPRLQPTGTYLLKLKVLRGVEFETTMLGFCDPFIQLWCGQSSTKSEVKRNTRDPKFETMLQIIVYEPTSCDLIKVQRGQSEMLGDTIMGELLFSWKDLLARRDYFSQPRWYSLYSKTEVSIVEKAVTAVSETIGMAPNEGAYQFRSRYGGRLLMSFEIEQNVDMSIGSLGLKATDAKIYQDDPQEIFCALKLYTAQNLVAEHLGLVPGSVQVEMKIGNNSTFSRGSMVSAGFAGFFQTIDLQFQFPYDNKLLGGVAKQNDIPMLSRVTPFPSRLIEQLPEVWIKVHKVTILEDSITRQLLGFKMFKFKDLLASTDEEDPESINPPPEDTLWLTDPCADPKETAKTRFQWASSTNGARWYSLNKDSTCSLAETDVAGYISFAFIAYIPAVLRLPTSNKSRILNPFDKVRDIRLHCPGVKDEALERLAEEAEEQPVVEAEEKDRFQVRAHFFQARSLPARNPNGLANAYISVNLGLGDGSTNSIFGTNNPTWDQTVVLTDVVLPVYRDDRRKRISCSPLAPRLEVTVWDKADAFAAPALIGRFFVDTEELGPNKPPWPQWHELFLGNPEKDDGELLCSFQLINYTSDDAQKQAPILPLRPTLGISDSGDDADDVDPREKIYRHINIDMVPAKVEIRVLGLRDITPWSFKVPGVNQNLWPVQAPYVEFICDDPDTKKAVPPSKVPSGSNANYTTVIELEVRVPDTEGVSAQLKGKVGHFAPAVDVIVYDNIPFLTLKQTESVIAHGAIFLSDEYPEDLGDFDAAGEDPEVQERRRIKAERLKRYKQLLQNFVTQGSITPYQVRPLMQLYRNEDARIMTIFEQYEQAPSPERFIERVQTFLLQKQVQSDAKKLHDVKRQPERAFYLMLKQLEGTDLDGEGRILRPADIEMLNRVFKNDKKGFQKRFNKARTKKQRNDIRRQERFQDDMHEIVDTAFKGYQLRGTREAFLNSIAKSLRQIENLKAATEEAEDGGGNNPQITNGPDGDALAPVALNEEGFPVDHPMEDDGHMIENGEADVFSEEEMAAGGARNALLAGEGGGGGFNEEDELGDDGDDDNVDEIDLMDDMEPVALEEVKGEITQEWLAFRHHKRTGTELERDTLLQVSATTEGTWEELLGDPFDEVPLIRGPPSNKVNAGWLKGVVNLYKFFRDKLDETQGDYRLMNDPTQVYNRCDMNDEYPSVEIEVRVYILRCFQMSPIEVEDGVAKADNFIRIFLGSQEVSDSSAVVTALNPDFYNMYKLITRLPGEARLKIMLADQGFTGSREIGSTTVDLEDRWFCEEWNEMLIKPIETRDLYRDDKPNVSQGKLEIFVDAMDIPSATGRPPEEINLFSRSLAFEMRVIIWETQKVAPKDGYTSDVYCKLELVGTGAAAQATDVHNSCKKAEKGLFNWRMIFSARFPDKSHNFLMRIQLWDENTIATDESIAEGMLPLEMLFREAFDRNLGKVLIEDMEEVWLQPKDPKDVKILEEHPKYPFRWFDMHHPNTGFGPRNIQGQLCFSMVIMPRSMARKSPVGKGREAPFELPMPKRPPRPANPIFEPEQCKAYIKYQIREFCINRKWCICCCCCTLLIAIVLVAVYLINGIFPIIK